MPLVKTLFRWIFKGCETAASFPVSSEFNCFHWKFLASVILEFPWMQLVPNAVHLQAGSDTVLAEIAHTGSQVRMCDVLMWSCPWKPSLLLVVFFCLDSSASVLLRPDDRNV